ncbi:endonuclease/exonuclease/phosphatase family protein [Maritimibacter sp. DP1N21-5]|uniref:endonuclease/exonuclease/phosphatase family protein n=1 Tax=Maritimibacter sp. DP1N21-5 TaxID=2836867 RepID=UPI001C471BC7|nr:endonuclease/exonuclease/phosphatase family protein [Maritimibacter sp. DP1N21-5]MBV7410697.1 endonuclease/exonuclease/phosphatase family protein [Maritimibacter sp. DP1N21-5]
MRGVITMVALCLATIAPIPTNAQVTGTREIIHYQKNIRVNRSNHAELAREFLRFRPDTISLQEIASSDKVILDLLKAEYPSQHYCYVKHLSGIAALSRWPMVEGTQTCFGGWGIAGFQVMMPEGPVWVLSAHIEVFFEGLRPDILRALLPQLEALEGLVIMGGDFNAEPFFTSTVRLAEAARVRRIGLPIPTFELFDRVGISIDHIMATGGVGVIMQRPKLTSDHFGVVGRFRLGVR